MLRVQEYLEGLYIDIDVPVRIKFLDWVSITISGIVVNVDFNIYVVLKTLFSGNIRVELYGCPWYVLSKLPCRNQPQISDCINSVLFLLAYRFHVCTTISVVSANVCGAHNHVVLQERRRTVNPLRRKPEFLANKTIKVNPNGGKQGGIPEKESPGIANDKSDPDGRQTEEVTGCPRGNSNKDSSRSNFEVPAKPKRNPWR